MTLPVGDYVSDYGSNEEERVLRAVRKYPSYSVDKLVELLPGIKRNKVQKILEKNNLSRLEQRLDFSKSKGLKPPSIDNLSRKITFPLKKFDTEGLKYFSSAIFSGIRRKLTLKTALVVVAAVFLLLVLNPIKTLLTAETPVIKLSEPRNKQIVQGESVFVSGTVIPPKAVVTINGKSAALNGNGEFTAITNLAIGKNILEVEANYQFKKASKLAVITRELSEEESRPQVQKEDLTGEVSRLKKELEDVLAAEEVNYSESVVEITEDSLIEENGAKRVVGELANFGDKEATRVRVIATFYGDNSEVVDVTQDSVTKPDEFLQPGEYAPFESPPTAVEFSNYELSVEWQ